MCLKSILSEVCCCCEVLYVIVEGCTLLWARSASFVNNAFLYICRTSAMVGTQQHTTSFQLALLHWNNCYNHLQNMNSNCCVLGFEVAGLFIVIICKPETRKGFKVTHASLTNDFWSMATDPYQNTGEAGVVSFILVNILIGFFS